MKGATQLKQHRVTRRESEWYRYYGTIGTRCTPGDPAFGKPRARAYPVSLPQGRGQPLEALPAKHDAQFYRIDPLLAALSRSMGAQVGLCRRVCRSACVYLPLLHTAQVLRMHV